MGRGGNTGCRHVPTVVRNLPRVLRSVIANWVLVYGERIKKTSRGLKKNRGGDVGLAEIMWFMMNELKKPPAGFEICKSEVGFG